MFITHGKRLISLPSKLTFTHYYQATIITFQSASSATTPPTSKSMQLTTTPTFLNLVCTMVGLSEVSCTLSIISLKMICKALERVHRMGIVGGRGLYTIQL